MSPVIAGGQGPRHAPIIAGSEAGGASVARVVAEHVECGGPHPGELQHIRAHGQGEYQAETSRQMLLSDFFDACFTSPLARSCRTAEIIWEGRDDNLIPYSDLREIDLIFAYRYRVLVEMPECDEQLVILISRDC
ncbi:hypothetical protein SETIT_6G148800v2 [Setaria italica]|uniref:Uncharacterized protein n=1 Tax=Setaria italica TaxID=4555 RepID=A0A368RLK9_SETIT|nr:hypothetical protein SETIT_6G148800v2 [Setaria italica]